MLYRGAVIYTITAKQLFTLPTLLGKPKTLKVTGTNKQTHYREIKAVDKGHH